MIDTVSPLLEEILGGEFHLRSLYADYLEIDRREDASVYRATLARIDTLTPAQEAVLPLIRDYWLRVGLSTNRTNREAAQQAVAGAYRAADLTPPCVYVWMESPLRGAIAAAQVWDQVRAQVRAQVGAQVGAQVWDQVRAQVWDQVGDQVYRCGYGCHDAAWLAFYAAFGVCGLDASRLSPLMRLAQYCGWWWPFERVAILTDKPTEIAWREGKCVGVWYADGCFFGEHAIAREVLANG